MNNPIKQIKGSTQMKTTNKSKLKQLILVFIIGFTLISCADNKTLTINGQTQVIESYGWFDESIANECVNYQVVTGNVVWSVILIETIIAPIIITGNGLWEPVGVKNNCR